MNKQDYVLFDAAREIAKQSDFQKHPVGCVIVQKGRIIGSGCNSHKTHPLQKTYNKWRGLDDSCPHKIHAELRALLPFMHSDMKKTSIYIYRIRRDRAHGLAKPCPSCFQVIKDMGIRKIYYTTDVGYAYEQLDY